MTIARCRVHACARVDGAAFIPAARVIGKHSYRGRISNRVANARQLIAGNICCRATQGVVTVRQHADAYALSGPKESSQWNIGLVCTVAL